MSSISEALHGHEITIASKPSDPGTLNAWLRTHAGYVNGTSDLDEDVVPRINPDHVRIPNTSECTSV